MGALETALERIPLQAELVRDANQLVQARCSSVKRDGTPCSSFATSADGTLCIAHDPARAALLAAAQAQGGTNRAKPRGMDVLRDMVEKRLEAVVAPLFAGLVAEKPVLGGGEAGIIGSTEDHAIRLRAADSLLDRVYGKPTQRSELSGPDGGPVGIVAFLSAAVDDLV